MGKPSFSTNLTPQIGGELILRSEIRFQIREPRGSAHPATRSVVQQRFALLWGRGAYDVYNAKMQTKKIPAVSQFPSTALAERAS